MLVQQTTVGVSTRSPASATKLARGVSIRAGHERHSRRTAATRRSRAPRHSRARSPPTSTVLLVRRNCPSVHSSMSYPLRADVRVQAHRVLLLVRALLQRRSQSTRVGRRALHVLGAALRPRRWVRACVRGRCARALRYLEMARTRTKPRRDARVPRLEKTDD
jgi:hypothetical protein